MADPNPEAQVIGRELGVDSVLEGTVQSAGERVRVTVQLVMYRIATHCGPKALMEISVISLPVQDTISERLAQALVLKLNGDEQRQLRKRETGSVEAYQEYLRGRYFWNKRDKDGLTKSLDHFQQAIRLDANYGQAFAGVADAYTLLAFYAV